MSNGVRMRSAVGFGAARAKRQEAANAGGGDEETARGREGESSVSSFLIALRNQISDYFTNSNDAVERGEKPEEVVAGCHHRRRCTLSSDLKLNCSRCGSPSGFGLADRNSIWHEAAAELYGRKKSERRLSGTRRDGAVEPSDCERRSRSGCRPSPAARNEQRTEHRNDHRNEDSRRNRRGAPKRPGENIDGSRKTDTRTDCESNGCKKIAAEPRLSGSCVVVKETDRDDSRQNVEPVRLDAVPIEPRDADVFRATGIESPDKNADRSKLEWKSSSDQQVLQFYKRYQRSTNKRIMNGKDGYRLKLHHLYSLDNQDGVQTERAKHLASKSENEITNIVAKYNRYVMKERKWTRENGFADEAMRPKRKESLTGDGQPKPIGFRTLEDVALLSKYNTGMNPNDGYRVSLTCSPAFMRRNKKCDQEGGLLYPNKRTPMFIKCEDECKKPDPCATDVPLVLIDPEGVFEVVDEKKRKKKKQKAKKKSPATTEECKSDSTPNTDSCLSEDTGTATAETTADICSQCANPPDKCCCEKTTPSASANTESCETSRTPPMKLCAHKPENRCKRALCKRCGKSSRGGSSRKGCLDDGIKITIGQKDISYCEQTKNLFCCCCRPECSFKDSLKQMFCISLPTTASSETKCCFRRNDYAKTCTFFFNKSGK